MQAICTINRNEAEGRQLIVYEADTGLLYRITDNAEPVAVDGYTYDTAAEAADAADAMWGSSDIAGAWSLEWCEEC